ncbi:MAG: prepilin-type N-terminal cleavage/methylation domain-containing protein [Thermodesulfobacteriota bacterium]|nr:prepilin-type N-terminal cleavage/methylation domain-containing protein [Thermodesulfobacteriota bacterium]
MKEENVNKTGFWKSEKGFTLIEMAIVLIIIGIIIGAIVKGKDIIKSAEQKKLYTKYVRSWQLAYNNYYDRTGWILGDDASDDNATRNGQCNPAATVGNLEAQLKAIGLTPPSEGPTGSSLVRTYADALGIQRTLTLEFSYNAAIGNFILITCPTGFPNDLGIAWDRIIDDISDGSAGDFRYAADSTAPQTNIAWPSAQTEPVDASAAILRLEF